MYTNLFSGIGADSKIYGSLAFPTKYKAVSNTNFSKSQFYVYVYVYYYVYFQDLDEQRYVTDPFILNKYISFHRQIIYLLNLSICMD